MALEFKHLRALQRTTAAARLRTRLALITIAISLCGCVRVEDAYNCYLQPRAKLSDMSLANADEDLNAVYLEGHRTMAGDGNVLHVEKRRSVKEWGLEKGLHERAWSVQISIDLTGADLETINRHELALDDKKAFISKWNSGLGTRTLPMPGNIVFPDAAVQSKKNGLIQAKNGVWTGHIQVNAKSFNNSSERYEYQKREVNFSCVPKLIEREKMTACAGQVSFKCSDRPDFVSTKESKFEYCLRGFQNCHDRFDLPIEPLAANR